MKSAKNSFGSYICTPETGKKRYEEMKSRMRLERAPTPEAPVFHGFHNAAGAENGFSFHFTHPIKGFGIRARAFKLYPQFVYKFFRIQRRFYSMRYGFGNSLQSARDMLK